MAFAESNSASTFLAGSPIPKKVNKNKYCGFPSVSFLIEKEGILYIIPKESEYSNVSVTLLFRLQGEEQVNFFTQIRHSETSPKISQHNK
ncbi:MAG: hypothetical protein IH946_01830 [Bacteroidetes bacterium]|nr:hypothetical protein [Bacteroidota bacterium]